MDESLKNFNWSNALKYLWNNACKSTLLFLNALLAFSFLQK